MCLVDCLSALMVLLQADPPSLGDFSPQPVEAEVQQAETAGLLA